MFHALVFPYFKLSRLLRSRGNLEIFDQLALGYILLTNIAAHLRLILSGVAKQRLLPLVRLYNSKDIQEKQNNLFLAFVSWFLNVRRGLLLHNIWPFCAQGTVSDKQWCPLFTGSDGTRYPPGRLGWHFRWVWSRRGCPLESGWWTWSQTGWRHQPIAAKTSESVSHLAKTGRWGSYRMKRQTHQERFKRRFYFASEEVIPVYMPEEWMGLGNTRISKVIRVYDSWLLF